MTVALYPGSFDPFHLGHLGVVERAARDFDEVIVAVAVNPSKPGLLPVAARVALIEASTDHLPGVRCLAHDGLTVDLAHREGADTILRALGRERTTERGMAAANRLTAGVETVFIAPAGGKTAISSSFIRSLVAAGRVAATEPLVPAPVFDALMSLART